MFRKSARLRFNFVTRFIMIQCALARLYSSVGKYTLLSGSTYAYIIQLRIAMHPSGLN